MITVELKNILPDVDQPRQSFDPVAMDLLEKSVKEKGILQPLMVEPLDNGKYLLIDGERRYRTAKKLNLKIIPVETTQKMTASERMVIRFHLQEQHNAWGVFDKARAIYFFMKSENLTAPQIAEMLGIHRTSVASWVGILKLSKRTQEIAINRRIPFTYLSKIAYVAKSYSKITDMPVDKIEEHLLEKIESRAIIN